MSSSINDSIPEFQKYQHQFVDYLRNPQKYNELPDYLPQKSSIYATLLFSKIEGSLDTCFPISRQLLGPNYWKQLIQSFIKNHHCQSPLYREIPDEFIDFLMNEQMPFTLPAFIVELAHYEWMELVLETAKPSHANNSIPIKDNLLSIAPALNPILHLLYYHYPVQTISVSDVTWQNWKTQSEPDEQEIIILAGLRDHDDNVQFIKLNTITARLIELLQKEVDTSGQVLLKLAAEMN